MDETGTDSGPQDESEFNQALERVLDRAAANGVDVKGGWKVDPSRCDIDWDIHIARVEDTDEP